MANSETCVDSFEKLIGKFLSYGPEFIYRGVTNAEAYKLIPKIGRATIAQDWAGDASVEQWMLSQFRLRARPYLHDSLVPTNKWDLVALAQHHGLPTRLLDWTQNPLAATFFAVRNVSQPAFPLPACAVYVVDSGALPVVDTVEQDDPFELKQISRFVPEHLSPRIVAQQALFTCHPQPAVPYDTFEEKLVIAWKDRAGFRKTLHKLGIHEASLFPDLDGVARHLQWLLPNLYEVGIQSLIDTLPTTS